MEKASKQRESELLSQFNIVLINVQKLKLRFNEAKLKSPIFICKLQHCKQLAVYILSHYHVLGCPYELKSSVFNFVSAKLSHQILPQILGDKINNSLYNIIIQARDKKRKTKKEKKKRSVRITTEKLNGKENGRIEWDRIYYYTQLLPTTGRCPIHPREAFGSDDKFYSSPIPLSSHTP